jgi:integrase
MLALGGVPDDNASQMDHRLEAACRAAGMKKYTAHHLRHSFGTTCLRNRVDVRTLQEWMGHADLATTMKYLHAVRAEDGLPNVPAPL